MALFRSKRTPSNALNDFWEWWSASGAALLADATRTGQPGNLAEDISRHVHAIHPDLAWEIGHGRQAELRFVVTGGGVAELRPIAERWKRGAPPADETWEFAAARTADPDVLTAMLEFEGQPVALSQLLFGVRIEDDVHRIHVECYHPAFANLSERAALTVAFLSLDWILGEDDVERWVGDVSAIAEVPLEAVPPQHLIDAVGRFEARRDEDTWAVGSIEGPSQRFVSMSRVGVRWIDYPLFDLHQRVFVPFVVGDDGTPSSGELDRLELAEGVLESTLATRGLIIARLTAPGMRIFEVYSDSEDQNITDAVARFAADHGGEVFTEHDPAWTQVRSLTG